MASELLYFNGVNASRGEYAREPLSAEQLAALISGEQPSPKRLEPDSEQRAELKRRNQQVQAGNFQVKEGVDETQVAQTGWGVIFPAAVDYSAVREALSELLAWRRSQAGAHYRECFGPAGYRPGESKVDFLRRQGTATNGPVDPDKFPYYLLVVGSPEEIPFRFQYQLDVQYAVGRLHFDTLQEYAQYARSVVAAERGDVALARRAVFFGVQNPDDPATQRSSRELVAPLPAAIQADRRAASWQLETVAGEHTTKQRLSQLLGGPETPAVLFTASHGVEFDPVDPRQLRHQGAILCQDWPGPRGWTHRALPSDFYFAGDDIGDDARLLGTIAFHFACFGAGTPRLDDFPHERGLQAAIAPHAFVAGLPRRLLGHPRGGALAVIGHVERAWTYSFNDALGGRQIETFSSAMRRIMLAGAPVGWALEFFNNRYAELASGLTEELEDLSWGGAVDSYGLTAKWTEHNDARSYVVLGDPAVRLPLAALDAPADQPRAEIATVSTPAAPAPAPPGTPPAPTPAETPPAPGVATPPPAPQYGAPAAPSYPPNYGAAPQWGAPPPGYIPGPIVIYPGYMPGPGVAPGAPGAPGLPGAAGQVPAGDASSFGIGDMLRGGGAAVSDTAQKLGDTLKSLAEQLGEALKDAIQDAATLEIKTYVADDLSAVDYRADNPVGAELRAVTCMSLDGDTKVVVPRRDGALDAELWAIHTSMVAQAQANRAEMIKAIAQAASGMLAALQGK